MRRCVLFVMVVLCLLSVACAAKRPPKPFQLLAREAVPPVRNTKPFDANSAAVGLTIKSQKWTTGTQNRLYLVQVDRDEDLYHGTRLIATSLASPTSENEGGGTVYVQNVPPGRYAAVGYTASVPGYGKNRELTVYLFAKDLIKRTDTTVAAGAIAFMGSYELGPDTMILNNQAIDQAQEHYFAVLWGKSYLQVLEDIRNIGTPAYFPVHTVTAVNSARDTAAESEFLDAAAREFHPAWKGMIEQRRAALR